MKTLHTASSEKRSLFAPVEITTSEESEKSTWDL